MNLTLRQKLNLPNDASDAFVIAECNRFYSIYSSIISFSSNSNVVELARKNLQSLIDSAKSEGLEIGQQALYNEYMPVDSFALIEAELDRLGSNGLISETDYNILSAKINALPEKGRKYYLFSALEYAYIGATKECFIKMSDFLGKACELDKDNPMYLELLNILKVQLEAYKIDEDDHSKEVIRIKRWKKFLKGLKVVFGFLGHGILWIGLGLLAVLGAIIGALLDGC